MITPFDHITNPEAEDAGESLGLLHESIWREKHRESLGDAVETKRGNARVQVDTLRSLSFVGRQALAEITRRAMEADWIFHSEEEYDGVRELLKDTLSDGLSKSQVSDLTFAVEEALPFMKEHSLDLPRRAFTRDMTHLSDKFRASLPHIRNILHNEHLDEDEAAEKVEQLLEIVADPDISARSIRSQDKPPPFIIQEYILDNDRTMLVITCDDIRQRHLIESQLRGYCEWQLATKTISEIAIQEGVELEPVPAQELEEVIPM